jgi:hypothetical protein
MILNIIKNIGAVVVMIMIVWQLDLQLSVQSVPMTSKVVARTGEVDPYSGYKLYTYRCLWGWEQFSNLLYLFRRGKRGKYIAEILLKVALNTINHKSKGQPLKRVKRGKD